MKPFYNFKEIKSGHLESTDRDRIYKHLKEGGLVICPSDTCYSVAGVCALDGKSDRALQLGGILNAILQRNPDWPFSVSVHNATAAERVLFESPVVSRLLHRFTPGPITVIGIASSVAVEQKLPEIIHSSGDHTIGVRIPDSSIERMVAEFAEAPITTVPAKYGDYQSPTQDYKAAIESIKLGIENAVESGKIEVEGPINVLGIEAPRFMFRKSVSTVVRVEEIPQELQIIRYGDISEEELKLFLFEEGIRGWSITRGRI